LSVSAQSCSKHVDDSNKHIVEEIVRQFVYLPELYEYAQSEKKKSVRFTRRCRTQ
jgi:hypothetical protein